MSSAKEHRRPGARLVLRVALAALAVAAALAPGRGAAVAQQRQIDPSKIMPPVFPEPPPEGTGTQTPTLQIKVEGNRRWCVRKIEAIWPNEPSPRRSWPRRGRRLPLISSLAYAHYVVAYPESQMAAPPAGPQTSPAAGLPEEAALPAPETSSPDEAAIQAGSAERAGPEPQERPAGGEGEEPEGELEGALEEESVEAEGESPASDTAAGEPAASPADADLALRPGAVILEQSMVFRTLSRRRVQPRGEPPRMEPYWDLSRSCCTFPNRVVGYLPPGRYTVQVNIDVLMRSRGWEHVQLARVEGVEIREGQVTELTLHVNTDGYIEIGTTERRVEFRAPGAEEAPAAQSGDAPQSAPAPAPEVPAATAPGGGRR